MNREEAHKALQDVAAAMRKQHHDGYGRLSQLDTAIATARMAVDYLFDDAENAAASKEG